MKTNLISITQGFGLFEGKTPEEIIVGTARVSSGRSDDELFEDSVKLISYLVRNKHWSPFEMVNMCVEIETSRAIAQQILRHRSFSFQEFSQRYASATNMEKVELRFQAENNRQSSMHVIDEFEIYEVVEEYIERGKQLYNDLINEGVARECARMVLPLTTQTRIYMNGSVRSWIHYLQIRADEHTQKEHRLIAESIKEIFKENFPNISAALES